MKKSEVVKVPMPMFTVYQLRPDLNFFKKSEGVMFSAKKVLWIIKKPCPYFIIEYMRQDL